MKHSGSYPHRMDVPDRHNGQRDVRVSVRSSVSQMEFDTFKLRQRKRRNSDVTYSPQSLRASPDLPN